MHPLLRNRFVWLVDITDFTVYDESPVFMPDVDHTGDEEEEGDQEPGASSHDYGSVGPDNNHNADGDEDEYTGYQQDTQVDSVASRSGHYR